MRDHFDITLERKLESNPVGRDHSIGLRRIELITGTARRRRWSEDDKARIVVESLAPGANASEVARRNGLSPQQLFAWRREARALFRDGGDAAGPAPAPQPPRKAGLARSPEVGDASPAFVPLVIASTSPPGSPAPPSRPGTIEITLGDTIVRVIDQVEVAMLVAVLRAVRRAS
jgi:transposase